jgi:chemotaxis protein MotB
MSYQLKSKVMKTKNVKFFLIPLCFLLLSSCVSTRKYTEAQTDLKQCKDQSLTLESRILKLQHSNDSLTNLIARISKSSDAKIQATDQEMQKYKKTMLDLQQAVKMEATEVSGIRQEICNALKCFTPDEITVKEKDGELYVSMYDKLLFPSGSAVVNKRGKEALKMLSEVLRDNNMKIMVEGHTDSVPIHNSIYKDNWDLSFDRATSVVRVLTKECKLNPNRVVAAGKGKYQPFYSNKTEEGRRLNRRTDIVLIPKLEELYNLINQNNNLNLSPTSHQ